MIYLDIPEPLKTENGLISSTRQFAERRGMNWDQLNTSARMGLMVSELRHRSTVFRRIGSHVGQLGGYDAAMRRLPYMDDDYRLTQQALLNLIDERYPWLMRTALRQLAKR